jgi:hypothetical protein
MNNFVKLLAVFEAAWTDNLSLQLADLFYDMGH